MVTLRIDLKADALYLTLDEDAVVESEEIAPGIIVDYNQANLVIGIELLHVSRRAPGLEPGRLVFEMAPASPRSQARLLPAAACLGNRRCASRRKLGAQLGMARSP